MGRLSNELKFYAFRWKMNLRNAKALHWNFILQAVGMFLNDLAFFVIWLMFSHAVGSLNGWGTAQTLGMLSFAMLVYGITDTLFGSQHLLYDLVPNGKFDTFLIRPKNLYIRTLNDDFAAGGIGDFVQGIIGLSIFYYLMQPSWQAILLLLCMIPPAMIAMVAFLSSCNCLAFWLPQTGLISMTLKDIFYLPSTQPLSLLRGKLRFFYMVVVPVLLVAGMPIEIITFHRYELIAVAYIVSLSWLALSVYLLSISIRHYESGNVIG